jgi:hypothetical protein
VTPVWLCGWELVATGIGYSRYGAVIDTSGNLYSYGEARNPSDGQRFSRGKEVWSQAELDRRYEGSIVRRAAVPVEEITRHMPLISGAAAEEVVVQAHLGSDLGIDILYCLIRDPATDRYTRVVLDELGEVQSMNPSPAARTLVAWLESRLDERPYPRLTVEELRARRVRMPAVQQQPLPAQPAP